ncbi:MAG: pseudouridine synthase [Phycisphaerales bacterium]
MTRTNGERVVRRRRGGGGAEGEGADALRDAGRPGAERLQRVLADAGIASRRACEALIEKGEVRVNGMVVDRLPVFVTPEDRVEYRGVVVQQQEKGGGKGKGGERLVYVMVYKPGNTVSTVWDPEGRRTVLDIVKHPSGVRLFPVGRLDYDSRGLLLMTNDGELANRLTHPRYEVHKTYRVLVKGRIEDEQVGELERGIYLAERREGETVGAKRTGRVELRVVKRDATRTVMDITLTEGRNRQVRRMLAGVGHPVKKLVRTKIGPLELKGLALGEWRELTRDELKALKAAAKGGGAAKAARAPSARTRIVGAKGAGRSKRDGSEMLGKRRPAGEAAKKGKGGRGGTGRGKSGGGRGAGGR